MTPGFASWLFGTRVVTLIPVRAADNGTPPVLASNATPNPLEGLPLQPTRYGWLRQPTRAAELKRVCRAWHESSRVRVPIPGSCRAEG